MNNGTFFYLLTTIHPYLPQLYGKRSKSVWGGLLFHIHLPRGKKTLNAQTEFEDIINKLEIEFKSSPTKKTRHKLEAAHSSLDQLLTEKAEKAIFYAKHKFFEYDNKPGRLLACLGKGRKEDNIISSLWDKNGVRHFEPKHITQIMKDFYRNLSIWM